MIAERAGGLKRAGEQYRPRALHTRADFAVWAFFLTIGTLGEIHNGHFLTGDTSHMIYATMNEHVMSTLPALCIHPYPPGSSLLLSPYHSDTVRRLSLPHSVQAVSLHSKQSPHNRSRHVSIYAVTVVFGRPHRTTTTNMSIRM